MDILDSLPDILKNSIVLGLLAFAIVYGYLYWEEKEKSKKRDRKMKKINILIPGAVASLVWFLSSYYFDKDTNIDSIDAIASDYKTVEPQQQLGGNKIDNYKYSKKGRIELPNEDLFLDIATF